MNGWFEALDSVRRSQGDSLDLLGLGPQESDYRIVHSRPGARLRHYMGTTPGAGGNGTDRPPVLIVPAPIKSPSIWDISPERSVVQQAVRNSFDVYLVEWTEADEQTAKLGLEDHVAVILSECVEQICERTSQSKVILMGHSLGGTFAALYSAYRPDQVAALVLVEAPVRFGDATGAFGKLLNMGVPATEIFPDSPRMPGAALNVIAAGADFTTFQLERQLDYVKSLGSLNHLKNHWRGVRWMLDEFAMPRQLFEDVVERLYRKDMFMRGELKFGGKQLSPRNVTAPLAVIYNPGSRIVPPDSVLDFHHDVKSHHKKLITYNGDLGVALQHIGALIGDKAHQDVWPQVFNWSEVRESSA